MEYGEGCWVLGFSRTRPRTVVPPIYSPRPVAFAEGGETGLAVDVSYVVVKGLGFYVDALLAGHHVDPTGVDCGLSVSAVEVQGAVGKGAVVCM